ncbi:SigE family RNA polymerase sigma factor [Virgisporangium aurantiacum]|uniref:RNA polymerase sigma24 factor n=1 Tax=Virgisporangium aurantiacum TaxID=175570 RepID=A0A8J3Z7T0_9ACTN|nr:SigE family RNA polymerase sigma factor [Virgisporangium aurantiacum]GIJ57967.1 RNA polymerase sigma24 factor [Virgisporangium aurantiacum]
MSRYEGFAEFVHARSGVLARVAYLLTGDHQHAEDLVQTALARTAVHWPSVRAGDPVAYVRRVLYHEHISRWRRRRLRETLFPRMPDVSQADPADATIDQIVVRRALARLSRRQRAVLVLRYFEDMTEAETAELLGIGVGTVKSHTRDALARLRQVEPDLVALYDRSARPAVRGVAR